MSKKKEEEVIPQKKYKEIIFLVILFISIIYGLYTETKTTYSMEVDNDEVVDVFKEEESLNELIVWFIDVGQADAILVENKHEYMLIDAGNNEDGKLLVTYLKELGISNLKYAVGTHPHEDHIGGMDDIIKNFKIDTFFLPDAITTTKTFVDVLDAMELQNINYTVPVIDSEYYLGDALIKVIYTGTETKDLNNTSIVLKLMYGNNTFLFTGDATSATEKKIISKDIGADVLKVGHHGSRYSSSDNFIRKVNPKYAVISVGRNNSYKHPGESTLNTLTKYGIVIHRTDVEGTVIATSDGNNISFTNVRTNTNG